MPLSTGISKSKTTTSGEQLRIRCSADPPSVAVATTSNSASRTERNLSKNSALSSATATRSLIESPDLANSQFRMDGGNRVIDVEEVETRPSFRLYFDTEVYHHSQSTPTRRRELFFNRLCSILAAARLNVQNI